MFQPVLYYYPFRYKQNYNQCPYDYYHEYVRQIDPEVTRMINLLNQERQKAGLNPLPINNRLTQVAQLKVNDVATTGNCQHYSPTFNGDEGKMLNDAGITGLKLAWILYCGQPGTAEEAINWWMNISTFGHRERILTPDFNYFGVATAVSQNGTRSWSVIFQTAQ
ncbi:CAP domain-containing protein [Bacillus clarus]|uniref:CAP domain-containing protein n=1 Tax=Bacillus clarus TaxID=2338372 RepID=A0A090Y9K3_9BACI|nr:CAP domain-containing protein [Bacillus clarus]KFM95124.1 cysteine-rich secretory family protein [Bacillus clarus]RFT62916.1 CAP domain-containing protein [Bacillus clarus]